MPALEQVVAAAIPILLAITVHEAAHGLAASKLGDDTAKREGRITLNPLPHIDPVGTILVPLLTYLMGGFMFGWAKPVPVRFDRLTPMRLGAFIVSFAGPLSNLVMSILWGFLMMAAPTLLPESAQAFAHTVGFQGIIVNVSFFALNLIPLPPLDGGRMLTAMLPHEAAMTFSRIEPYGFWILIALMMTGLLSTITRPIMALALMFVGVFVR